MMLPSTTLRASSESQLYSFIRKLAVNTMPSLRCFFGPRRVGTDFGCHFDFDVAFVTRAMMAPHLVCGLSGCPEVRSIEPRERFLLLLLSCDVVVEMLAGIPSFKGAVDVVGEPADDAVAINPSFEGASAVSPVVFKFPVAAEDFTVAAEDPTDEVEVNEEGWTKEATRALPTSVERHRPMASCPDGALR